MEALSLFCERAWMDYPFETCIGLPTYIIPTGKTLYLVAVVIESTSGGSEFSLTLSTKSPEEI